MIYHYSNILITSGKWLFIFYGAKPLVTATLGQRRNWWWKKIKIFGTNRSPDLEPKMSISEQFFNVTRNIALLCSILEHQPGFGSRKFLVQESSRKQAPFALFSHKFTVNSTLLRLCWSDYLHLVSTSTNIPLALVLVDKIYIRTPVAMQIRVHLIRLDCCNPSVFGIYYVSSEIWEGQNL